MVEPALPPRENERLEALHQLGVLTSPDARFERVARLAERLFDVPLVAICLVGREREWTRAARGPLPSSGPREASFAAHVLTEPDGLVVPDATIDLRFHDHPLVSGSPNIRFFAGYPIVTEDGHAIGALCIADDTPRDLDAEELRLLADLSGILSTEMHADRVAHTDDITGLTNRRGFRALADFALANSRRAGDPATMLYLELDDFHTGLEIHGPTEADDALAESATLLRTCFRDSDLLARLGGPCFGVLLGATGVENLDAPLARFHALVEAANLQRPSSWQLSFSFGYASYDATRHHTVDELVSESSACLYDVRLGHTA